MFTTPIFMRFLFGVTLGLLSTGTQAVGQMVPIEQDRSVWVFVINPRCQPGSGGQQFDAPAFDPFQARAELEIECSNTLGRAEANQQSEIQPAAIRGSGDALSRAEAETTVVIHAFATSELDVTFSLAEPTHFTLIGEIRAVRNGVLGQSASAAITLLAEGDIPLATQSVIAPADGSEARHLIDESGPLPAGTYRLMAGARTFIDSSVPPSGGSEAEFVLRLSTEERCPADLNGDGDIDLQDLALLLADFGCSERLCLSDIDGDDDIDLADLALLLAEFGTVCP